MERVGGDYGAYLALREDERAHEDVIIVMLAEQDAAQLRKELGLPNA